MEYQDQDPKRAPSVNTEGGSYIDGPLTIEEGDFVGRDKHVHGDEIRNTLFNIPRPLLGLIMTAVLVGLALTAFFLTRIDRNAVKTGDSVADIAGDTEQVVAGVANIEAAAIKLTEPTPTPTPEPMRGDVNVALAKPIPLESVDSEQVAEFQDFYVNELKSRLDTEVRRYQEVAEPSEGGSSFIWEPEIRIIEIPIDNATERHALIAEYADDIYADIVLYGSLTFGSGTATLQPEFYIHPRFADAATEMTGPDAFGNPSKLTMTGQGADRSSWSFELDAPIGDLSAFIVALGLFDAKQFDLAIDQLDRLLEVGQWAQESGKSIAYLWLGSAHFSKAVEEAKRGYIDEPSVCTVTGTPTSDAECARLSYEQAQALKPDYPRSYIGLGNYWLELARGDCARFDEAAAAYTEAQQVAATVDAADSVSIQASQVPIKVHYQLGLAHGKALDPSQPCLLNFDEESRRQHDETAQRELTTAVKTFRQASADDQSSSLMQDLAARASYMLGLVHRWQGRDQDALTAFVETIEIAGPYRPPEDGWKSIRWVALNQIGAVYLSQFVTGDLTKFEPARDALLQVTNAYKTDFGLAFDDEPAAAAASSYNLGRLFAARASIAEEAVDLTFLLDAEGQYRECVRIMGDADRGVIVNRTDGLPWICHLALGDVNRQMYRETDDVRRANTAIEAYQVVLDAYDGGEIANAQLANELFAQSAFGLGAVYAMLGDAENAVIWLDGALAAGTGIPELLEQAELMLEEVNSEVVRD